MDQAALLDAEELACCCTNNEWLGTGLALMKQRYEQLLQDMQAKGVSGEEDSQSKVADLCQQLDRIGHLRSSRGHTRPTAGFEGSRP